jgi:anti-sigma factor RsiW
MSACRAIAPVLEAFRDGELSPERVLEVEQHLIECARCVERVRFSEAIRLSVRQQTRSSAPVTPAFQARVAAALEAARELEERTALAAHARPRLFAPRTLGPMAVAAAVTLAYATNHRDDKPSQHAESNLGVNSQSFDALVEALVDNHVSGQPDLIDYAELLPKAEREVGVPLSFPNLTQHFRQYGGRWEGVSVVRVTNQQAASFRYKLGGHRMTLYVYDSSRFPVERCLEQRLVGAEPVYVGVRRGYSIGATQHRGVGYALASDLSDTETAELIAGLN